MAFYVRAGMMCQVSMRVRMKAHVIEIGLNSRATVLFAGCCNVFFENFKFCWHVCVCVCVCVFKMTLILKCLFQEM